MKLLFTFFPPSFTGDISKLAITGGDRRFIEVGNRLAEKGFEITVITTTTGFKILKREGLKKVRYEIVHVPKLASFFMKFALKLSWNLHVLACYFFSILFILGLFRSMQVFDIVYSPSDSPADIFAALLYKHKSHYTKWVSITYQRIPFPWKRSGAFFMNFVAFASQQLSYRLMRNADLILVNATQEGKYVIKLLKNLSISPSKIALVKLGTDVPLLSSIPKSDKSYDACFVAALGPPRGLYDIVPVWKRVVASQKHAVLAVIGKGNSDCESFLKREIIAQNLSNNIELFGYLRGENLYKAIKSCRVFIALNREGSWGIAVCEGMALGLPVIAYDLQAYDIYTDGMIRVPIGDFDAFANAVLNVLEDGDLLEKLSSGAKKAVEQFDWNEISQYELVLLNNLFFGKNKPMQAKGSKS